MLPLDAQNERENSNVDMQMMWYTIMMTSLFYLCVVLPYGLFFAETDESLDWKGRLCQAFKK